jgi:alpha-1,2-mannosyltransferase
MFVMLALLILGTDPFVAFVSYQLPRIVSGEAFSFSERADVPAFIVSRNYSIYGLVAKLRLLSLVGVGPTTAHALTWAYTVLLLWLAWRMRLGPTDRRFHVTTWLALLNLAALRSPVAPSAYVTAPMLWSLALLAAEVRGRYSVAIALGAAWVVIMGPPPLPEKLDLVFGLLGQGVALALGIWMLMRSSTTMSELPTVTVSTGLVNGRCKNP